MPDLQKIVANEINAQPKINRLVVGVSGGVDSMVLLHCASCLELTFPLLAVHINHQLSADADGWQREVEHYCGLRDITLITKKVDVVEAGGPEKAARIARYQAFESVLQTDDLLLLAHHADDQAETLLLRLLRGAGLQGLAAIPRSRKIGPGILLRPFLTIEKQELIVYAKANNIAYVNDTSNANEKFDRNFIRHNIIPLLKKRWPAAISRCLETTELLNEQAQLMQEYVNQDYEKVVCKKERLGISVNLSFINSLTRLRKIAVLREWFRRLGENYPSRDQMEQIIKLTAAAQDAQPRLQLGQHVICRYDNKLYCLPILEESIEACELSDSYTAFNDGSCLEVRSSDFGLDAAKNYHIKFREGGERCHPYGRQHSQTLKKLLQEYQLEPWLRDRIPIIYCGDQIAAVGDLWVEKSFFVTNGRPAIELRWFYSQ